MESIRIRRGAALVAVLLLGAGAPPPPVPTGDRLASGLRDLHYGLYSRAERSFLDAARSAPDDPQSHLFLAFNYWWHLSIDEDRNAHLNRPFDRAIAATLAAGQRRLERAPQDLSALTAVGSAHILRSHVEARRRRYFRAAREARRGRKRLIRVLARDPGRLDAQFTLGAFNYYADRVPLLVKGLRAILFLPGGDADLGLRQLRAVAESGSRFRTDARILLAVICGSREERCYEGALGHLRRALADNPGSPLIRGLLAELQMRLGHYDEAAREIERAIADADGDSEDRARQRAILKVALAEALVAGWRLREGERVLGAVEAHLEALPPSALRRRARVRRELDEKRGAATAGEVGSPAWAPLIDAALEHARGGRPGEAIAALNAAAAADPESPIPRFLKGRTLLRTGRAREAIAELEPLERSRADPPEWMQGWIEIYLGLAHRELGRPRAARSRFRRAGEVRRFRSADRGLLELRAGEPEDARCAP
ncbi:MAG: tetratricopeptide repeat protein [Acidobacteriota bacterium]